MNKFRFIILSTCCLLALTTQAQKIKIKTGIEVLKEQNFKCLEGKRVGLITNPTGVDNRLKSTIDILHEAPNVNLVALYGPEHGVRGDVHAGDKVDNSADSSTGLPKNQVFSRDQLLNRIWGYDFEGNTRTVDTHIKTLRQKLGCEGQHIVTLIRSGYKFEV